MMVACKELGREGKMSAVGIWIFSGVPPTRISLKMPLLRLAAFRGTSKNMLLERSWESSTVYVL